MDAIEKVHDQARMTELAWLYVDPKCWRKGIGQGVMPGNEEYRVEVYEMRK